MPRLTADEKKRLIVNQLCTAASSIATCNDKTWREGKHFFQFAIGKLERIYAQRQAEADDDRALLEAARNSRNTTA